MQVKDEFVVGKHNIGWVDKTLLQELGSEKLHESAAPTFKVLPRYMTDTQIESELKPGFSTMSDVLSFIKNAPQECKDGNWNLFYTRAFVVSVFWYRGVGEWSVLTWQRVDVGWFEGLRVFSPATSNSATKPSTLGVLDTAALPAELTINGILYKRA